MILEFTLLQDCMDGWTLDKFELTVQGIEHYQFIVDQFTTSQLPVCSSSSSRSSSSSSCCCLSFGSAIFTDYLQTCI